MIDMKKMLSGVLAVVALTGIMGLSSAEAAPKPKTPPPNPPHKVEHQKPMHEFKRHHDYVLVQEHRWRDYHNHRHLDRIWRDRHGHRHVEHVF